MKGKQQSLFETDANPAPGAYGDPAVVPLRDRPARPPAPRPARLCLWPGCKVEVEPKMWGCQMHWYMLPQHIRSRIWDAYRPGQENNRLMITKDYVKAAEAAKEWIARHGVTKP